MRFRWILALPLLMTGCSIEGIVWSPDGKTGLVATPKGSYLFNPLGKISPVIPGEAFGFTPCVWVPGTNKFVLVQINTLPTWDKLVATIDANQKQSIQTLAAELKNRLETFKGNWSEFTSGLKAKRSELAAAWMYLRDVRNEELQKLIEKNDQNNNVWNSIAAMKSQEFRLVEFQADGLSAKETRTLRKSLDAIVTVRFSPDGAWIAMVDSSGVHTNPDLNGSLDGAIGSTQLNIMNVENPNIQCVVDDNVGEWSAWSTKGNALYYFRVNEIPRIATSTPLLGTLREAKLTLSATATVDSKTDLLDTLFNPFNKIVTLPTGELLFVSHEWRLPKPHGDQEAKGTLAIVDPARPARFTRIEVNELSKEQSDALAVGNYSASPDGTKVALTTNKGATDIIDLTTGKIDRVGTILPSTNTGDRRTMFSSNPVSPSWRSNDELTFIATKGSPLAGDNRHQFILWSPERTVVLSRDWKGFFGETTDE